MKKEAHILALGGGGFRKNTNLQMERYFLHLTERKNPHVCFIPTASGESLQYIVEFYSAFNALEARVSHLSFFDPHTADMESFLLSQDAIYVGGGNTKSMLALWKEWKVDLYLKRAWEEGIVLGGVSAGSLCWFEEGVTDSIPGDLTAIRCLGILPGSNCPHYDSEEKRRPSYQKLVREGMSPGYAADDYVALHDRGKKLEKVVRSQGQGVAYYLQRKDNQVIEERIAPQDI
jgi:peptidase E